MISESYMTTSQQRISHSAAQFLEHKTGRDTQFRIPSVKVAAYILDVCCVFSNEAPKLG